LENLLLRLGPRRDPDTEWQPRVFDLSNEVHANALSELLAADPFIVVHDTLRDQLFGLIEVRDPSTKRTESDQVRAIDDLTHGVRSEYYGRWVFYPWSHRLVHVLPESEFRELRASANRNKVTTLEQDRLSRATVGIVGLSSGAAIAVTLALEGVGGHFVLADFDRLELANMNRLNVGVHELGLNKAVSAARRIFEIHPFCQVEIFPEGLTPDNVDALLTGSRFGKLDIVFEQCDDLYAKFLLRERARSQRVCVLMQTSDRGVMDVERFDLDPGRAVFHGLAGDVKAASLRGMTTYEKIPTVLKILDMGALSERMAASLIDIETTLKSWPQLASEIALGAAVSTDVARRILLGQMTKSGRFRVDVPSIVCDEQAPETVVGQATPVETVDGAAEGNALPRLTHVSGALRDEDIRTLVAYASAAPSGGNCQPWHFSFAAGVLRMRLDAARAENFLDYRNHASYLALGAAAENALLAAGAMGVAAAIRVPADLGRSDIACELVLGDPSVPTPPFDPLVAEVGVRVTNRCLGTRAPMPDRDRAELQAAARSRGGTLTLLESDESLDAVAGILGRVEMIRMLSPIMHGQMMREIRWTRDDAIATRDGLEIATLELSASDLAALRLIASWALMKTVGALGGGRGLARPVRKALERSTAVGLLRMPHADSGSFFQGGRALERVWLTASRLGWALQPMTTITYLFDRYADGGDGLTPAQLKDLEALRVPYDTLFDVHTGEGQMLLFRLHKAGPPTARALRRRVGDILDFEHP
jgi:hypothetical protein